MKLDEAIETTTRFFNDLIGSVIPAIVLIVGLSLMHLGPFKIFDAGTLLSNATLTFVAVGLMFAGGHILTALFDYALHPTLRAFRIVKKFDETKMMDHLSYQVFAAEIDKFVGPMSMLRGDEWNYHDLRSIALSLSSDGASLGRRFMFISLLCNGVGTALIIVLLDFIGCLIFDPKILFPYPMAVNWGVQSALLLAASIAMFKRGENFYGRALATPFPIALAELMLRKENNVGER